MLGLDRSAGVHTEPGMGARMTEIAYRYGAAVYGGEQVFVWSGIAWYGGNPCYMIRCVLTGNWSENSAVYNPRLAPRGIDGLEFA